MNDMHRAAGSENFPATENVGDRSGQAAQKPAGVLSGHKAGRPRGLWLLGLGALLPVAVGVAFGASQRSTQDREVMLTTELKRTFVPAVRVVPARASDSEMVIALPATTLAFAQANIFARTSGYIEKREADIGDHVKAGGLLAEITAPELDHQIAQAEATLSQDQAALQQMQASSELARVTRDRNKDLVTKGWVTPQQGDTDRLTVASQQAAVAAAQSNIAAQQALIRMLRQQKIYQRVVAPFDGIVTQRNIDTGSLVQSGSTFMFTFMQSDVLRVQVYVPQDAAFGVTTGVEAVVRVPEIADRTFPGKVTRFANALAPGTRTLLTEIDVPNPDGVLSPGVYCTVELHIPRKNQTVEIPADALVFNSDGLQVAVNQNGTARFHKVTVVRDLGTEVEVSDGIKPGDEVILRPMVNLADGSKVQALPSQITQK